MKILVTGMTSTQANPSRAKKDSTTFSAVLATALRGMGHEVDHRTPTLSDTCEEYDRVICGIQAPHAVGANRIYGALNVIGRAQAQDKLVLFIDDAAIGKILGGMRTMRNNPERFTKQYYNYRLEYETAAQEPYRSYLYQVMMDLLEYQWPPLLIGMYAWGDPEVWARKLPNAHGRTYGLDLSRFVPTYDQEVLDGASRAKEWVVETYSSKWTASQRLVLPAHVYGPAKHGFEKRPSEEHVFRRYARSWGVVYDFGTDAWWDPVLVNAMRARAALVSPWQKVQQLGSAFSVLPDTASEWSPESRDEVAQAQAEAWAPWEEKGHDAAIETLQSIVIERKIDAIV